MATEAQPAAGESVDATSASSLSATSLAQFGRLQSCERYLWYRLHTKETHALMREWGVTEQPLTPLLTERGAEHEEAIAEALAAAEAEPADLTEQPASATAEALEAGRGEPQVLPQAAVEGALGPFTARGIVDIMATGHFPASWVLFVTGPDQPLRRRASARRVRNPKTDAGEPGSNTMPTQRTAALRRRLA